jgi:uncharacterized membrane protein
VTKLDVKTSKLKKNWSGYTFWAIFSQTHLVTLFQMQIFIGIVVLTFALAFAASLVFEAPFLGLEKIVLGGTQKAV